MKLTSCYAICKIIPVVKPEHSSYFRCDRLKNLLKLKHLLKYFCTVFVIPLTMTNSKLNFLSFDLKQ